MRRKEKKEDSLKEERKGVQRKAKGLLKAKVALLSQQPASACLKYYNLIFLEERLHLCHDKTQFDFIRQIKWREKLKQHANRIIIQIRIRILRGQVQEMSSQSKSN